MPDPYGNLLLSDLGLDPGVTDALQGSNPITLAAVESFRRNALPVIQHQFALQGLGSSPALGVAVGDALAQMLPQTFFQGEQLTQGAAGLAAQIANQEAERQLQAFQTGGTLLLGLTQPFSAAVTGEQNQQQLALQGLGAGGQVQQDVTQRFLDSLQADLLRRQGLAEASTTGLFGGSVIPPTATGTRTTGTTSSSK